MKPIIVTEGTSLIPIGKQGENNAVPILFRVNTWRNEYGDGGLFTLNHKRATDTVSYPVTTTLTDGGVLWLVNNADNAIVGYGECELRYTINNVVKKSVTWRTLTVKALSPIGDTPPDPWQSWYDSILTASENAITASDNAADSADRAEASLDKLPYPSDDTHTWWIWDNITEQYIDSGVSCGTGSGLPEGGKSGDVLMLDGSTATWQTPADSPEKDNTKPITAAAVYTTVGNISALLETI